MTISTNEVHLWCVYDEEITSLALLSQYHELLSCEEQKQQKRFCFERDRHQYLITRVLVRTVLSRYIPDVGPKEWQFSKNSYGKPSIVNTSLPFPVKFNISHSGKLVVLAVTRGVEIGVDVEYILRDRKNIEIVDRFFSVQEIDNLKILEKEKQYDMFFKLWTLKEAYIKARGMGLSIPLDKFSFHFSENNKITIMFDGKHIVDDPQYWRFWHIMPNNTHKISIALREENVDKEYLIKMHEVIPLEQNKIANYPIVLRSNYMDISPQAN